MTKCWTNDLAAFYTDHTDLQVSELFAGDRIVIDRPVPTIRFHLDNAMKKLNASNCTQAAAPESQLGILGPLIN